MRAKREREVRAEQTDEKKRKENAAEKVQEVGEADAAGVSFNTRRRIQSERGEFGFIVTNRKGQRAFICFCKLYKKQNIVPPLETLCHYSHSIFTILDWILEYDF